MKLIVAGKDRSADLGGQVCEAARSRVNSGHAPRFLSPQHSALSLKEARSEKEYLERFLSLLSIRQGVSTAFKVPRRPGLSGVVVARFKDWVWRLVHYRMSRIIHQQNVINELFVAAVEFENDALKKDMQSLQKRVSDLERASGKRAE